MRFLVLLGQVVVMGAASLGAWLLFGSQIYTALAALIAAVLLVLFTINAARDIINSDQAHSPLWTISTLVIALLLGLFWPGLPIAFSWGALWAKHDEDAA